MPHAGDNSTTIQNLFWVVSSTNFNKIVFQSNVNSYQPAKANWQLLGKDKPSEAVDKNAIGRRHRDMYDGPPRPSMELYWRRPRRAIVHSIDGLGGPSYIRSTASEIHRTLVLSAWRSKHPSTFLFSRGFLIFPRRERNRLRRFGARRSSRRDCPESRHRRRC